MGVMSRISVTFRPAAASARGADDAADDAALRTLAGARVGVGALAADRQALAVAQAAIAAEIHQALDVEAHLAAQVAFDLVALFERLADAVDLVFGEVLRPLGRIELRRRTDLLRGGLADPVQVLQRGLDLLLAGKVYACNTRHLRISSALPLLVTGVRRADHAHHALAAAHLALHADSLHR